MRDPSWGGSAPRFAAVNPPPCPHPHRGRERCRHFVLDQLPDGRYVILGECSAHAELGALLRHHATAPIAPYRELLTVPCPRVRI